MHEVMKLNLLTSQIVQSVNSLLSLHCELESGMVAVERLLEYAALPSEVRRVMVSDSF